jgi:hypothetical protein
VGGIGSRSYAIAGFGIMLLGVLVLCYLAKLELLLGTEYSL